MDLSRLLLRIWGSRGLYGASMGVLVVVLVVLVVVGVRAVFEMEFLRTNLFLQECVGERHVFCSFPFFLSGTLGALRSLGSTRSYRGDYKGSLGIFWSARD